MAIETDVERAVFFNTDDFGVAGTYTPSGGSASTVNGIFDKDFSLVEVGNQVGLESNDPRFLCRSSDVPSVASGDTMVVNSVTYTIRNIEDDGQGMTTLALEA